MDSITMSDLTSKREEPKVKTQSLRMSDIPKIGVAANPIIEEVKRYPEDKYLYTKIPPRPWKNKRCFIVGGGDSLKGFDFSRLNGELVIAINRAWEFTHHAISFFLDEQFWGWTEGGEFGDLKDKYLNHPSYKVTVCWRGFPYPKEVNVVDHKRVAEFSQSLKDGIYCGSNSGTAALNLAIALGADPIYLLGFDMDNETEPYGKMKNFHSGYPNFSNNTSFQMFKDDFEITKQFIKSRVKVFNLNRKSKMRSFPFLDFRSIKKIKRPIITSFYSPDYTELSIKMGKSVNLFGFETDIQPIAKKDNWVDTMYQRAEFVKRMLNKHKRDIVWLDCDAVMWKYPELFDNFKGDFGVHFKDDSELLGGTMYFAYTPKTLELVDKWIELNKTMPKQALTQKVLQEAVKSWNGDLIKLPAGYTLIFDTMAGYAEPVIEHYQASRKFRYA